MRFPTVCHWHFYSTGTRWTFAVSSLFTCLFCNSQSIFKNRIICPGYLALSEYSTWINLQMCKFNSLQLLQSSFITDPFKQIVFFHVGWASPKLAKPATQASNLITFSLAGNTKEASEAQAKKSKELWKVSTAPQPRAREDVTVPAVLSGALPGVLLLCWLQSSCTSLLSILAWTSITNCLVPSYGSGLGTQVVLLPFQWINRSFWPRSGMYN